MRVIGGEYACIFDVGLWRCCALLRFLGGGGGIAVGVGVGRVVGGRVGGPERVMGTRGGFCGGCGFRRS
jgi:hypothetical protein